MLRKILLIFGFVVVVFGIGFAIYFIFFRVPPPAVPPPVEEEIPLVALPPAAPALPRVPEEIPLPEIGLPRAAPVARGGLTQTVALTTAAAEEFTIAADGVNLQYYNKAEGKFYRITPDGQATLLTDKFPNVEKVNWSKDKNQAILEFPDGQNVLYNFSAEKQVATLPKHWESFDFSPKNDQIVSKSIGIDPNNRWLIVANPDGSDARAIEELGDNADRVDLSWSPNNQILGISRTGNPQGLGRQEVFFLGQHGERFNSIVAEGTMFEGLWSKKGDRLLYSVTAPEEGYRPTLWVVDAVGDSLGKNRRKLGLNTWVSKCAFSNNSTAYCAAPESLKEGVGLLPEIADTVPDVFYKINIDTGAKTLVAKTEEGFTVNKLLVSLDERFLYFTDKATGALHKIRLK